MIGIEMCGVLRKWFDMNGSASSASMPNHTTWLCPLTTTSGGPHASMIRHCYLYEFVVNGIRVLAASVMQGMLSFMRLDDMRDLAACRVRYWSCSRRLMHLPPVLQLRLNKDMQDHVRVTQPTTHVIQYRARGSFRSPSRSKIPPSFITTTSHSNFNKLDLSTQLTPARQFQKIHHVSP